MGSSSRLTRKTSAAAAPAVRTVPARVPAATTTQREKGGGEAARILCAKVYIGEVKLSKLPMYSSSSRISPARTKSRKSPGQQRGRLFRRRCSAAPLEER